MYSGLAGSSAHGAAEVGVALASASPLLAHVLDLLPVYRNLLKLATPRAVSPATPPFLNRLSGSG